MSGGRKGVTEKCMKYLRYTYHFILLLHFYLLFSLHLHCCLLHILLLLFHNFPLSVSGNNANGGCYSRLSPPLLCIFSISSWHWVPVCIHGGNITNLGHFSAGLYRLLNNDLTTSYMPLHSCVLSVMVMYTPISQGLERKGDSAIQLLWRWYFDIRSRGKCHHQLDSNRCNTDFALCTTSMLNPSSHGRLQCPLLVHTYPALVFLIQAPCMSCWLKCVVYSSNMSRPFSAPQPHRQLSSSVD